MTKLKWLAVLGVAVVALVVGGTWIYINVIREDAPPPLALDDLDDEETSSTTSTPSADDAEGQAADGIEGTWITAADSIAGYRVNEVLFGQSVEAVGRTNDVDGTMTIDGTMVTTATFEIDMTTISSDESRRDGQFAGPIMSVDEFPTATFELTEPIDLGPDAADGSDISVEATGELMLRGTTQTVSIPLQARLVDGRVEVVGSYEVVFADWAIPNPSRPGIDTEDQGVLEVLLSFERG
jgi:polyisoprenoid-binding protein YceI